MANLLKRRRTDVGDGSAIDAVESAEGMPEDAIVRDENYYIEGGDCIIRVGNVLFKIHRYLLNRDASAFSNMFSLPQGSQNAQGNTDDDPLVLYDHVDDFRALCWIIYALPTVHLEQTTIKTSDFRNLVGLYLIAQKYHFEAHERFASRLLHKHCLTLTESDLDLLEDKIGIPYIFTCPESRLESLLRISTLADINRSSKTDKSAFLSLPETIQQVWTLRLKENNEPIGFALEVATVLGLRTFTASLCYLQMTRMVSKKLDNSTAYIHPANDLTPGQNLILYKGYWSLRQYWWDSYRDSQISDAFDCEHGCQDVWRESWKEAYLCDSVNFDPIEMLEYLECSLNIRAEHSNAATDLKCAYAELMSRINDLRGALPDHFLGPVPESAPDTPSAQ
ncbi:hypothetical protein BDN70DRAFT_873638 [Pholiota conissans]|uniref:BTB domain-containing protein n=1 Tax=Pholiota conissans TaxID=109636 RepID=A0A9P5Z9Z5_9AGAR|nr:hypothetical protein BDN70DRAFT_873638 [Pholiota conissans]